MSPATVHQIRERQHPYQVGEVPLSPQISEEQPVWDMKVTFDLAVYAPGNDPYTAVRNAVTRLRELMDISLVGEIQIADPVQRMDS